MGLIGTGANFYIKDIEIAHDVRPIVDCTSSRFEDNHN